MYNADVQAAALAQWKANGTGKLTYVNNAMGCESLQLRQWGAGRS
jgi:hypothetical protein